MKKTTKAHSLAQRSLVAGAAGAMLTAVAGMAQAQNVTLFGRIDGTVEYIEKANAAGDSLTRLNNGGILPSIWGLKGSEDLGGGLKAVFNLESDFDSSTGGDRFGGGLRQFGRQANVGISSGFGTVLLGRQYAPALLAELGVEPRGYKESYSGLLTYALNQNPTGNGISGNNFLGIFLGNMISYSGSFGPANVFAGYALGENASSGDGEAYSAGANAKFGPFTVAGSYQQIKGGPTSGFAKTERYAGGIAAAFGIFTVKGHYARAEEDLRVSAATVGLGKLKTDNWGVGVDLAWLRNNTATLAYYEGKSKSGPAALTADSKSTTIVLSNDYALSKRTTLYGQFVYVDAGGANAVRNEVSAGVTTRDEKSSILGVGIKHDF